MAKWHVYRESGSKWMTSAFWHYRDSQRFQGSWEKLHIPSPCYDVPKNGLLLEFIEGVPTGYD